jgi:voltage-gated potassium channel
VKNRSSLQRLLQSLLLLAMVVIAGGAGYYALGEGRWSFGQSIYMSIITVSTVGFAELPGSEQVAGIRALTGVVIVFGIGAVAYFQSTLTALLVEGALGHAWRRKRMKKQIETLSGHVVVAGLGSTGRHVAEELCATGTPFVAIDRNREHLERVASELEGLLYVHGDATDDEILRDAGVARASGIVTTLNDDKANLFVTLSARSMNASARIVARVIEPETTAKMMRAGATATVSPNMIGGRRMANELLRPEVTAFFDEMLRDKRSLRLEEIAIRVSSPYAGRPLGELPIRHDADVLVLAVKGSEGFRYNPPTSHIVDGGSVLVVLGDATEVGKLRRIVGTGAAA